MHGADAFVRGSMSPQAEAFKQNELLYDIGCVVSFNPFTLRAVRRMDPRIPIMLTHRHQVLSESLARKKARERS